MCPPSLIGTAAPEFIWARIACGERAASPRQPARPTHPTPAISTKKRLRRNIVISCPVALARDGPKSKLWEGRTLGQQDSWRRVARHTRCCFPNALDLSLLGWRLAIGSHPFPPGLAVSHHIKTVKPPEAVAIGPEGRHCCPNRFQPRREMPSANEFANLAGPKARQRFVIPVIFRVSGADGRVVVQYAGLHDRERRRSRMAKSKVRRHCHMRGMRPLRFR